MENFPKNLREIHKLGQRTREWLVRPRQVPTFARTHIRVAGFTDARRGYRFVRHSPNFSQILACTEGEGRVWVKGEWQRCSPGMAYVNAAGAFSAYHASTAHRWKVCWVIYEAPGTLPGLEPGSPPRLVHMDAEGMMSAVQGLCRETAGESDASSLSLLAALVHRFAARAVGRIDREPRLDSLWQTVREEISAPWSLARMARGVGASEETLRRLTQKHLGLSPMAQVTKLRMEVAADLLLSTGESVASIAERVGYEDAFAFSHAFKRHQGKSPRAYRLRGEA